MDDISSQISSVGDALNPLSSDKADERSNLMAASLTSAVASIGTGLITKDKVKARILRNSTFFTATFAAGLYSDVDHGDSPSTALLVNSLSSIAGIVAFNAARRIAPVGFKALASAVEEGTGSRIFSELSENFAKAVKNTPQIEYFLNKDTIGLAGASLTIPVAHTLVHRIVADGHRRRARTENMTQEAPRTVNQAGSSQGREEMSGERPVGTNEIQKASFNIVTTRYGISALTRVL